VRLVYLKGDRELIARRITMRHGHFMPPALLDSQFATLEEPTDDERAIVVSIDARPHEVVKSILAKLALAPSGSDRDAKPVMKAQADSGL
jgi:gluconokinase